MIVHLFKKFQAFCRNRTSITMSKTTHHQNKAKCICAKISNFKVWTISPSILFCSLSFFFQICWLIQYPNEAEAVAKWKYWHSCNYQNLYSVFQVLFEILPKLIISESPNLLSHIFLLYRLRYSGLCI